MSAPQFVRKMLWYCGIRYVRIDHWGGGTTYLTAEEVSKNYSIRPPTDAIGTALYTSRSKDELKD